VHKESENGSVDYPVHALRRGCELRRPWTGLSGDADFDSSLGELHRGVLTRLRGLDGVGNVIPKFVNHGNGDISLICFDSI
jgi:hypothetical protein